MHYNYFNYLAGTAGFSDSFSSLSMLYHGFSIYSSGPTDRRGWGGDVGSKMGYTIHILNQKINHCLFNHFGC